MSKASPGWHDLLPKLRSRLRGIRMEGWQQLRTLCAQYQFMLTEAQRQELSDLVMDEEDDGVWRLAVNVLLGLPSAAAVSGSGGAVPHPFSEPQSVTLGDWLWDPFHRESLVFSLSDPNQQRRDEPAVIALARHLSAREFPLVDFRRIWLGEPQWNRMLTPHHQAICLIGRLGLYGSEALERWSDPQARFGFWTHTRPQSLRAGTLDPQYHCLYENQGRSFKTTYATTETDGRRKDYGLVQRYVVDDGTRHIVVLTIAGGSSLGTLAAAQWAADNLILPNHPDGARIPLPGKIEPGSRLEALLEVTADVTGYDWLPSRVDLLKLYVDDAAWSKTGRDWNVAPPSEIKLLCADGDPARPIGVYLDGHEAPLKKSGQLFRLLVALCTRWVDGGMVGVSLQDLIHDKSIWKDTAVDEQHVRHRLAELKTRYLRESLHVEDLVHLHASVSVEEPPLGEQAAPPAATTDPRPWVEAGAGARHAV